MFVTGDFNRVENCVIILILCWCKKSFWGAVTLTAIASLLWHFSVLYSQYYSYLVNVVIEMEHQKEMTFPAVTICNMNPVKRSMLWAVPQIQDFVSSSTEMKESSETEGNTFEKGEKLAEYLADSSDFIKQGIGYHPYEMILDCQFSGIDCYWQQFQYFHNPIHGNCYMFNSGWNQEEVKIAYRTGRRFGLRLVLNTGQEEYLPDVSEAAGLRVVVHHQDRMPFPQDEGVALSPGMLTSVGLIQLAITREPYPHGNCTDSKVKNITRNVFEEHYDVGYTVLACYKTCYQRYLIQRCGCGEPQYPMSGVAFGSFLNITSCKMDNLTDATCKQKVDEEFRDDRIQCPDCVLPCKEFTYKREVSTIDWPSDVHEANLVRTMAAKLSNPETYKDNLIKLEVYFEEFNYKHIKEVPAYTGGQFVSDIGGVLGLWLGLTILSVFELVEFCVDLIVLSCMKASQRRLRRKHRKMFRKAITTLPIQRLGCKLPNIIPSKSPTPPPIPEETPETVYIEESLSEEKINNDTQCRATPDIQVLPSGDTSTPIIQITPGDETPPPTIQITPCNEDSWSGVTTSPCATVEVGEPSSNQEVAEQNGEGKDMYDAAAREQTTRETVLQRACSIMTDSSSLEQTDSNIVSQVDKELLKKMVSDAFLNGHTQNLRKMSLYPSEVSEHNQQKRKKSVSDIVHLHQRRMSIARSARRKSSALWEIV